VIDPRELELWLAYVNSFGTGDRWFDYLLLPVSIYRDHRKFSSFFGDFDFPNILFLLVFFYPLINRKQKRDVRKTINSIFYILIFQFIFWALGSQQNRFLAPLFPLVSIVVGAILLVISSWKKTIHLGKIIVYGIFGGIIILTIIIMTHYLFRTAPFLVIFGYEDKSDFLKANLIDYSLIELINTSLPEESKVFFPWNGKGYYCDNKCYHDISQAKLPAVEYEMDGTKELGEWILNNNITHVVFSLNDFNFVTFHGPTDAHSEAYHLLFNEFIPINGIEIYTDEWVILYEIVINRGF